MLMEKTGDAQFRIVNPESGKRLYVDNSNFLTPFQIKQMATQPDFIIEYAELLGGHYAEQFESPVEVYVDSYVAINGRRSQRFVKADVNLLDIAQSTDRTKYLETYVDGY